MGANDTPRPRGIDISKWQVKTPDLTGVDFMIARASIGTTPDERYAKHIAAAKAAGVLTGAYHFNWDEGATPIHQAQFFLDRAGDVDMLALDVEGAHAFDRKQTEQFITEIHRQGKTIGLYHSLSGYFDAGQDWRWVAYWPRNLANEPPIAWDIWQYGSDPLYKPTVIDGDLAKNRATLLRIVGKDDDAVRYLAVPEKPSICEVPKGTVLYRWSDLRADPKNVTLTKTHPGLRYIGTDGNVAMVGWDQSPDIPGMSGMYVADPKVITNIRPIEIGPVSKPYEVIVGGKSVGKVVLP